jgi:hypothetical protein
MLHPAPRPGRVAAPTLRCETLEDRVTPSWGSVPPAAITLPTSGVSVALNSAGDASGRASITANEIDWYRFTVAAGATTLSATTPSSSLDTVIGLYNTSGQRVAYNDDIATTNTDSRTAVTLPAGTYYLGVTNYTGTRGGSYTWAVDGPAAAPPSPPVTPPATPPVTPPPPPATSGFSIALRETGMTASQQAVFDQAAARWAQVIVGDLPDATYNGVVVDDVLIDASAAAIDGPGGVLGSAGPDTYRSGSLMPIHGTMQFDTADLAALEASGQLFATILHEMGHVLGIGTLWQARGLVTGVGTADPRFTGAQATAAYDQIFGTTATSVPVENTGGSGTAGGHWRESVFGNELMTGYLDALPDPLSRVTVGALADFGYQVNFAAADSYAPPGGAALVAGSGGTGSGLSLVAGRTVSVAYFFVPSAGPAFPAADAPRPVGAAPPVTREVAPARRGSDELRPAAAVTAARGDDGWAEGWADRWDSVLVG